MDILYFLKRRLDFIKRFCDTAAEPFQTTKRKIENGQEPFVPKDIESGEPEYDSEWGECEDSLDVLGQCCLSLVKASLQAYLEKWALRMGGEYPNVFPDVRSKLTKKKGDRGWLGMYQRVFLEQFGIDWNKSPVPVSVLEEIVLTRNDFEHNVDIAVPRIRQSDEHSKRFPRPIFADEFEVAIFKDPEVPEEERAIPPWRLTVDRTKLHLVTDAVRNFCEWLEDAWDHWPPQQK